jgi:hypothetical protein
MSEQTNSIWEARDSPMRVKNPLKGFDGPLSADPKQQRQPGIDLIDQRQILVAFGVLGLVDADGPDGSQRSMRQSRAAEYRRMAQAGYEPVLKKSRWCQCTLCSPMR